MKLFGQRYRPSAHVLLAGAAALVGCGRDEGVGEGIEARVADSTELPTAVEPSLRGELMVGDGCAEVRLGDGTIWAESCLEPGAGVLAVRSATVDEGELALLRFRPEVDLVSTDPDSVKFQQADGWAFVESPTFDFTMTFRQQGVAEQAVCVFNPFFIDCDVEPVAQTSD